MKLRLTHLIQAVFAMVVVVSLSFGANAAFASAPAAAAVSCPDMGGDYYTPECGYRCLGGVGYCAEGGFCRCGYIP
jgi:hypothetical protein